MSHFSNPGVSRRALIQGGVAVGASLALGGFLT